jgi:hypothetical protein
LRLHVHELAEHAAHTVEFINLQQQQACHLLPSHTHMYMSLPNSLRIFSGFMIL